MSSTGHTKDKHERLFTNMGIITGLKKIRDFEAEVSRRREGSGDGGKDRPSFLSMEDGESRTIRFLQELDEDSTNYSAKNGTGILAVEHQGPGVDGWKRRALCTNDDGEGECFPCQQRQVDWENWKRPGARLYIAVADVDTDEVFILSQGTTAKSVTPTLLEYAGEEGSITDRPWKITRSGVKRDTSWLIMAKDRKQFDKDVEDYDVPDLRKVVKDIPFEEQQDYYMRLPRTNSGADDAASAPTQGDSSSEYSTW